MKNSKKSVRYICHASLIAAIYTILTFVSSLLGLSSGVIQVRFSEALCILPLFTPAAVPGLTVGCLVSNLLTGCAPTDVLFGSIATLLGALGGYLIGRCMKNAKKTSAKIAVALPNVAANTLIIPWVLKLVYSFPDSVWYFTLTVGIGEIISCIVLGLPLLYALEKRKRRLFKL